jgi:GTP-binding protein
LISKYVIERQQLTNLFVLIDSRLTPQRIDLDFIDFLGENGVPFAIIFTKSDKITNNELKKNVQLFVNTLSKQWEELPPYFVSSSATGNGRNAILDYIDSINKSL